ncbi:MAG: dTMP kinase [Alcaligenaceae bacterium]|nr:dTMP kinase [Alcaligenaceae bacterium]
MAQKACLITLEGLDGAGKSTHIDWISEFLRSAGVPLLCTREPGGTPLGEELRSMLLAHPMHLETETLLMFAARSEHLHTVIRPTLARGQWVLCDRFTDASFAYQGGGRGLGAARIGVLEHWLHPDLDPVRTYLFDVPLEVARERLKANRELDRIEREDAGFFERTRAAYLDRVRSDPQRFRVIDSSQSIARIREDLEQDLRALVAAHGPGAPS